jgi:hypothetical protein
MRRSSPRSASRRRTPVRGFADLREIVFVHPTGDTHARPSPERECLRRAPGAHLRADCLDRILILGRGHLEHVLRVYRRHYGCKSSAGRAAAPLRECGWARVTAS